MPACLQCGEENPEQARFCLACGSALRAAARGRAGAERKVVTVLFVDVVGFTRRAEQLDPEDVSRLIGPYYALVRGELERFGGTVEKFIGDAVMALFGAPAVHEDDAERALRAAFAIRQAIDSMNAADPELDLQVRIGVMSGVALVDLDADATRGETLATGDVVNTAARLQENAPTAGIVVGEPTRRLTADVVEYRELEPITAKGKHTPLRAWEAVLLRSRRDRGLGAAAPLVGRDEELELLLEAVESPPRFLTLVGAPGVGKSRLLWELAHALDARGGRFLWRQGRCLSYGTGAAYWGLGEVVKTHARILETDGAQTARRKLHDAVTRAIPDEAEAAWVEGHLRPLVGLGSHDQLSVDSRVEAFSAWRRFLEALAVDGTLVLVFEDLHWADEGLLDFAEHLAGWVRETPIVVICTARPELLEQRPDWPGVVRLEPLARDDTAALLDVLLERGLLADGVWDSVLDRAAGNPLYAVEYARMLAGRRMEGELPPPESLQAIVAARLDAIPPDSKRLLQDAAVVGKGFWAGALVAMSDRSYDDVERALVDLQRREFVRPHLRTSVSGESQYAFSHVLIRDVAYAEIPTRGAPSGIAGLLSGSSRSRPTAPASPRCSLITTRAPSSTPAGRDRRRPRSRSGPGSSFARPGTGRSASTPSRPRWATTGAPSTSGRREIREDRGSSIATAARCSGPRAEGRTC